MRVTCELTTLSILVVLCGATDVMDTMDAEDSEETTPDQVSKKIENLQLEGSKYLQKVMSQLQSDRTKSEVIQLLDESSSDLSTRNVYDELYKAITPEYDTVISAPTPVPDLEGEEIVPEVPPLELTSEELLALYRAAVEKAAKLKLAQKGPKPEESFPLDAGKIRVKPSHQGQMNGPLSGYYYYYFPIKSLSTEKGHPEGTSTVSVTPSSAPVKVTSKPSQHLHATVTMVDSSNKSVEPLFMAITSFIGMALMFFFSVIFVPRFQKIRSKNAEFKDEDEEGGFGHIILEAMAGRDCGERLGCEIARMFRGLKSDNKTLRVLEIILPPNLSNQVSHIRKAAGKRGKCTYISCKDKKVKPPPQVANPIKVYKPKPWKEKPTPHELWMSHFEKNKKPPNSRPNQQKNDGNRPAANKKT